MSKTKFVDFRAVKAAITMEQLLQHYGVLDQFKRTGDSLNGPCPIHKGSNPTQFRVSTTKNLWNCFSDCEHGGNALDFICKMEKCSIHAAALKAIEWFNLDPEAMSAGDNKPEPAAPKTSVSASKPAARPAASPKAAPESNVPNAPLKFRLDKLERNHPYLLEQRGHGLFLFADESVLQSDMLSTVWQCGKAATMSALVDLPASTIPHVS